MPRPLKFPTKLLIGFDDDTIKAIDGWRREQEDLPNRSESVRRLVSLALGERLPVAMPSARASASKPAAGAKAAPVKKTRSRRS
jgi:hypothetical protein